MIHIFQRQVDTLLFVDLRFYLEKPKRSDKVESFQRNQKLDNQLRKIEETAKIMQEEFLIASDREENEKWINDNAETYSLLKSQQESSTESGVVLQGVDVLISNFSLCHNIISHKPLRNIRNLPVGLQAIIADNSSYASEIQSDGMNQITLIFKDIQNSDQMKLEKGVFIFVTFFILLNLLSSVNKIT